MATSGNSDQNGAEFESIEITERQEFLIMTMLLFEFAFVLLAMTCHYTFSDWKCWMRLGHVDGIRSHG
uniref:Cation_ATPase_C domain-containing protein n=1 Tax=Panagrellus redivivus TaxID=6233 RepID=A0A7E4VL83_PANRE